MQDAIAVWLGDWSAGLTTGSVLLRLGLSLVLSAILGFERASKRHSAGLRTFILVSLASTVAALMDLYLMKYIGALVPAVSAAAIIGAAMISGNSILFSSRNQIKGLTTSAGLWGCALIGLALGAGLYLLGLAAFVTLLCCLSLLPYLERYLKDRSNHFEVHLELKNRSNLQDFITTIRRLGLRIDDIESNAAYLNSGLSVYSIALTIVSPELKKYKKHEEIIEALRSLDYVSHIEEML